MRENVTFLLSVTYVSLNTMIYSHAHFSADDMISFLSMVEQNSIEYNITFSSSALVWHLGYLHILAIASNAAVNMNVQVSLWCADLASFRWTPRITQLTTG